jgi:5-formyltetrahydrofolate cyclo-ligase
VAVGIGYAAQEVPEIPTDPHDEKLDWIVTETYARRVDTP